MTIRPRMGLLYDDNDSQKSHEDQPETAPCSTATGVRHRVSLGHVSLQSRRD